MNDFASTQNSGLLKNDYKPDPLINAIRKRKKIKDQYV